MAIRKDKFKADGKTRRCRSGVFHYEGSGAHYNPGYASQCEFAANYDGNKFCYTHSRAAREAREAKALERKLAKAKALLAKHGEAK